MAQWSRISDLHCFMQNRYVPGSKHKSLHWNLDFDNYNLSSFLSVPMCRGSPIRSLYIEHVEVLTESKALCSSLVRARSLVEIDVALGDLVSALAREYHDTVRVLRDELTYQVHTWGDRQTGQTQDYFR